jgi:peptidoglycan/LPS O-acetylase OafA/YrhL
MIMLILAYEWLSAVWDKFSNGDFMNTITQTLTSFASQNPHGSYANFLTSIAIPNASLFGNLVRFSELLVGLGLLAGAFIALRVGKPTKKAEWAIVILLFLGLVLNVNFYFAAGWTSQSTAELNKIMAALELVLIAYYGIDLQGRRLPFGKKR